MAFVPKEWKDRLVEFAGRRKLTNVSTGEEMIVDVVRNEGAVSQEGDAFSGANMSDLEQRVADEFNNINTNLGVKADSLNKNKTTVTFPFTVPKDGYMILYVSPSNLTNYYYYFRINGETEDIGCFSGYTTFYACHYLPVKKGEVINKNVSGGDATFTVYFR